MEEKIRLARNKLQKYIKENQVEAFTYKCWDCRDVIEGLEFGDDTLISPIVSLDGYKMIICETCCEIEE